jgi:hypothetical protein
LSRFKGRTEFIPKRILGEHNGDSHGLEKSRVRAGLAEVAIQVSEPVSIGVGWQQPFFIAVQTLDLLH